MLTHYVLPKIKKQQVILLHVKRNSPHTFGSTSSLLFIFTTVSSLLIPLLLSSPTASVSFCVFLDSVDSFASALVLIIGFSS